MYELGQKPTCAPSDGLLASFGLMPSANLAFGLGCWRPLRWILRSDVLLMEREQIFLLGFYVGKGLHGLRGGFAVAARSEGCLTAQSMVQTVNEFK
jgi:hypothetical protein